MWDNDRVVRLFLKRAEGTMRRDRAELIVSVNRCCSRLQRARAIITFRLSHEADHDAFRRLYRKIKTVDALLYSRRCF